VDTRSRSNELYAAHHLSSFRFRILGNEMPWLRLREVGALVVLVEYTLVEA
jgi:hypothetical protein